jgi:DNA-binding GntR family transcriptional regulator
MAAKDEQPLPDQVMLSAVEAEVYEAIATLEFIGHQVTAETLITASDLDEDSVLAALRSLAERGVVRSERRGGALVYIPSHRGWSAAPEQATNPSR